MSGAQTVYRSYGLCVLYTHNVVGELTAVGEVDRKDGGRGSSENAGMSSESKVRIFTVESLRFPGEGSSAQGKSGPKPRPKGVGDGQQVEIPVLPLLV
jgi:hypothetical protein